MASADRETPDAAPCGGCGADLPMAASLCPRCGWDATTAVLSGGRRRRLATLVGVGGVVRVVGLALVLAVPVVGFLRLLATGPGPDLPTTLRWMVAGDGGRAAELTTIHRAFEIASAAARYAVRELEAPSFADGWSERLAPFATMNTRGWIPLVLVGADSDLAPASVKEMFRVQGDDGWGRPYRVSDRLLERGGAWESDPAVAADLAIGLNQTLFTLGRPELAAADHLRVEIVSAGPDGQLGDGDDLRLISYLPVGFTFAVTGDRDQVMAQLDTAFFLGRHYFRLEGNHWDLVDARLLAEFRLDCLSRAR